MRIWIDQAQFEHIRKGEGERISIEGGFDAFERIDIRGSDEEPIHIFKVEKKTELFEIEMRYAAEPEGDESEEEDFKEMAKSQIRTDSSYQASHYLKSMDLPPLQSLFSENMVVELIPDSEDSDDD